MRHFLEPLVRRQPALVLADERTGLVVASTVEGAFDSSARNRGLMGRGELAHDHALVLAPCWAIHTWRMRFPIDVLFADRDGRVVTLSADVPPGRIRVSLGAFATIELRAGALAARGVRRGDRLRLEARGDVPDAR